MNYAQTLGATGAYLPIITPPTTATVISTNLAIRGFPVRVASNGDVLVVAGGTVQVQLYRSDGVTNTPIGKSQVLIGQAANTAQGFAIEAIDPEQPSGTYTYSLQLLQSNGATTWGIYSGVVINALEIKGALGPTGMTGPIATGPSGPIGFTGVIGPTGPAGDGFGAMNFTQNAGSILSNVPVVPTGTALSTIISTSLQTQGYPVRVAANGDVALSAGATVRVQLYRNTTPIGNSQTIVGQAANTSQGFSIETIDTATTGTYTYALNLIQSNGITSWGTYSGNVMNALELRGTQGPTGPNPDGVGPMNYTQTTSPVILTNVPVVASAANGSTIVSAPLQTLGNPVRVAACGDVVPGMGGSLIVQFYRYVGSVSTAIGSPYTVVAGAANQSQGFSLETIDDNPAPGAYTYALNLIQSNGTTSWGQYSGAVLNAVELRGARGATGNTGATGPNLTLSNNVFSGTNAFTNTVTISSLHASTTGNLLLATTNVSTQNTQIVQTATSNPTTSYTTVQAFQSNTAGSGITYNTLALNPNGGNVGIGLTNPVASLHVLNSIANPTSPPDDGLTPNCQILVRNTKTGSSPYSMAIGMDQTSGAGYLNAAGNGSVQPVCLNTRGGNVGIGLTNPGYQLQLTNDSAAKPTTSTWTISSDQRLKQDIVLADTQRCMEIIKAVPLKRYTWRSEVYTTDQVKDRSKLGWIAQDVEQVFPKAVGQQRFVYDQQWSTTETGRTLVSEKVLEDCRDLNVDQMYAVMYGAISRLIEEKESLREELTELRVWAQSQGFNGSQ
jgi:hypothetical protein